MAFCIFSRPTPVASGEGVDRGRCSWVLLNNTNRPRKKTITKLNDFIIVFTSYSIYNAPKMMVSRFPHTSHSSHLPPYFSPLRLPVFGWLLCEPLLIDGSLRPWCIHVYLFFVAQFDAPNDGTVSPRALSRPRASALTSPLLLLPILGWFLYAIIKRRPPKSRAPPISLFFYASFFGAPNRQTSHRAAKPDHGRLAWDL